MLKCEKKHSLTMFAVAASAAVVMLIAMLTFLAPDMTVFAAELGDESPEIYCTYFKDDVEVDGNKLTAGTYDVSFNIKGVENFSTLQFTATYDSSVSIDSNSLSLMSDELADVTSMGTVVDNASGNLVFGFVSDNANYSSINSDGQVVATMSITFTSDCDAADVIIPSTNPHHTFVQVNYNDGHADEYALVSNEDAGNYNGVLYPMTCDITPSNGHSVSGSLVIMKNSKGSTDNKVPYGVYTINVYDTPDFTEETEPIKTINTVYTEKTDNTEASNLFTIDALPTGTYYASISSTYALPREDIVITMGNEDITGLTIPIIACNFMVDAVITVADAGPVYQNKLGSVCDLNGDGRVTVADAGIVYSCSGAKYNGFEIK